VGNDVIKKKLAQNPNLKMISGERCKKLAQNPNLNMISGEYLFKN
jgi:hypothetical protein